MKPYYREVFLRPDESFTCVEWHLKNIEIPWQYLSHFVLMGIIRGRGMRCLGDNVGRFREGELVMFAPGVPVSWWSDEDKSGLATNHVSASFQENFLGDKIFTLPEAEGLARLFFAAKRGLIFPHQLGAEVIPLLLRLSKLKGWERLYLLLDILHRLATGPKPRFLASAGLAPELNEQDAGRLTAACKYISQSYKGAIRRQQAATLAGLSPQAFSRFFHKKMGQTFEAYVTEIRLSQACHKLAEGDSTIAEVAYESGFNNLSNFNRHFQKHKNMTPRQYRQAHAKI